MSSTNTIYNWLSHAISFGRAFIGDEFQIMAVDVDAGKCRVELYRNGQSCGWQDFLPSMFDHVRTLPKENGKCEADGMTKVEALAILAAVKAKLGRNYKRAIRVAWMNGNYDSEGLGNWSSRLQQIRNAFGPSWLVAAKV